MAPITSLDQIIGNVAKILVLGPRAIQPNPLNILLLGDGFTEADQPEFEGFIGALRTDFLRIAPFSSCETYINFFYCMLASKTSGVFIRDPAIQPPPADPWETVFRAIFPNGLLFGSWDDYTYATSGNHRIRDVVSRLVLPESLNVPPGVKNTPDGIWFDPRSKSFGAVCIVAKNRIVPGAANVPFPFRQAGMARPEWRYFGISTWGYDTGPNQLGGGYAHIFAHELAHSLDLFDEYEETKCYDGQNHQVSCETPPATRTSTGVYHNVDYFDDVSDVSADENLGRLKWRKLLTTAEFEAIRSEDNVFTRDYLRSSDNPNPPNDIRSGADWTIYETVPREGGGGERVHWSQAFVIEGAYYGRRFVRSNFECKMRHALFGHYDAGDSEFFATGARYAEALGDHPIAGSPEFCKTCTYHIRHHITSFSANGVGGVDRNTLELLFRDEIMPRLIKSFEIETARTGEPYSIAQADCDRASIRAYAMFRSIPGALRVRLNVTPIHVALDYQGVLLDPTFLDSYRVFGEVAQPLPADPLADTDLRYAAPTGMIAFKSWEVRQGFVGTRGECAAFVDGRRLLAGSYAHASGIYDESVYDPDEAGEPEFTPETIVFHMYGRPADLALHHMPWVGPADDPDLTKIELSDLTPYHLRIPNEWRAWLQYLATPADPSVAHLLPLDMTLPLRYVMSL